MKYRVEFTPEAKVDLLNLYNYIAARNGVNQALAYIERIERECMSLETFPIRGKSWDALRPGLRIMGFERRVTIAFQVNPKVVTIFRLLYGGRDLKQELKQAET